MYINLAGVRIDPFGALAKKEAVAHYENTVSAYHQTGATVQRRAEELYTLRTTRCKEVIEACEAYLSALANAPKEFEKSIEELAIEYKNFDHAQQELQRAAEQINWSSAGVSGGGVLAGAGVATFAPTAAMAIATTFGTASTGTAIASLSGAAATNAAVAWLGGGAIAAGGGGMAAGNALLALAGPVGWAIGGAALVGGAIIAGSSNGKVVRQAYVERLAVEQEHRTLTQVSEEVHSVVRLTRHHASGVDLQLERLRESAPEDYLAFGHDDRKHLSALINNVRSLSELIQRRISA